MAEFVPTRANVLAKFSVLSSSQAVEYCGYLLDAPLTAGEFYEFATNFKTTSYLRHCDLHPLEVGDMGSAGGRQAFISDRTLHEVVRSWVVVFVQHFAEKQQRIMLKVPLTSLDATEFKTTIDGVGHHWQINKDSANEAMEWLATPIIRRELYYLPQDIEALAQKILDDHTQCDKLQPSTEQSPRPTPKYLQQEKAILTALRSHGYVPTKLPVNRGKAGAKSKVRTELLKSRSDIFYSVDAFNSAWKKIRAKKLIKDAK